MRFGLIAAGVLLLGLLSPAAAQETGPVTADSWGLRNERIQILEEAQDARQQERNELAVEILEDGITRYPEFIPFYRQLGELYEEKELYRLASDEYRRGLARAPEDNGLLSGLSRAQGYLGEDERAYELLVRLHELNPDDPGVISDLGWSCFKTFRLEEGIKLLEEAVKAHPDDEALYMTLGTLHSGAYHYQASRKAYLQSIALALDSGYRSFLAVAYYNLSLLEHDFSHYERALEYSTKSLEYGDRSAGYIARGELYMSRLDYRTASAEFLKAYTDDSTPLALVSRAELFLEFGLLDKALALVRDVQERDDGAWMYRFGTDRLRHQLVLQGLLGEIYTAMSRRESRYPQTGLARLRSMAGELLYSLRGWYHRLRMRKLQERVARLNGEKGNRLEAAVRFYEAAVPYRSLARGYLETSQRLETALIPDSRRFYILEEGILEKDPALLRKAVTEFDDPWESRYRAEALGHWLLLLDPSARREAYIEGVDQLYRLNPGLFLRREIAFPLEVAGAPPGPALRVLRRAGFLPLIAPETGPETGPGAPRFMLFFSSDGFCRLTDRDTDKTLFSKDFTAGNRRQQRAAAAELCRELTDRLFLLE